MWCLFLYNIEHRMQVLFQHLFSESLPSCAAAHLILTSLLWGVSFLCNFGQRG